MENQDEYVVYIEKIGNRFYYKNGQLHREVGPAYVPWSLKDKYSGLEDQDLYKIICKEHIDEPKYKSSYFIDEPMHAFLDDFGRPVKLTPKQIDDKLRIRPTYPCYHLEGVEFSKQEFDAIMLDKQLFKNGEYKPKIKI
jgi:hypothetical protein